MVRKAIKDKVYYITQHLGIPKSYLHLIIMESEATLRLWSYNPANVNEDIAKRIYEKLRMLDIMGVRIEDLGEHPLPELRKYSPRGTAKHLWKIHVNGREYTSRDFVEVIRNALYYEMESPDGKTTFRYSRKGMHQFELNAPICQIANDKSLELPVGVTRWKDE